MRYAVREKLFSIGDDFWITDEQGGKAFLVDGKVLRLRQTLEIQDPGGRVLVSVRKKLIALHETMEIEEDGAVVATVRKALVSPLHHRSIVDLADGSQLEAVGNILDKEFEITAGTWPRGRTTSCSWPSPSRWTGSSTTRKSATGSKPPAHSPVHARGQPVTTSGARRCPVSPQYMP